MARVLNRGRELEDGEDGRRLSFQRMGVPAIPSSLILCIVATRQGSPSGSLRKALTGPGHDAKTFLLIGGNGRFCPGQIASLHPFSAEQKNQLTSGQAFIHANGSEASGGS